MIISAKQRTVIYLSYIYTNPNPDKKAVGDCVIRAIAIISGEEWEKVYMDLAIHGLVMHDMPSSNAVWGDYLRSKGYKREMIPDGYTVHDFCHDNICDRCILATGTHVIAVIDGDYLDAWDSGYEVPIYYWKRDDET